MEVFTIAISIVSSIVLGIIVLTLFVKLLRLTESKMGSPGLVKMNIFLKNASRVNVHLSGGRIMENVKFIGFTDQSSMKGGNLPYHLSHMVVLENAAEKRILIRADAIKMIEEVDESQPIRQIDKFSTNV
jgi:hypothetical protein